MTFNKFLVTICLCNVCFLATCPPKTIQVTGIPSAPLGYTGATNRTVTNIPQQDHLEQIESVTGIDLTKTIDKINKAKKPHDVINEILEILIIDTDTLHGRLNSKGAEIVLRAFSDVNLFSQMLIQYPNLNVNSTKQSFISLMMQTY